MEKRRVAIEWIFIICFQTELDGVIVRWRFEPNCLCDYQRAEVEQGRAEASLKIMFCPVEPSSLTSGSSEPNFSATAREQRSDLEERNFS